MRAEHRASYKGLTAILRGLDLVHREGKYLSNFTGRIETGVFQWGHVSGPVEKFAKLEGGWNYLKLCSTLFFSYWLLRERNFRPKRNRPIACRAVRLLVLFPHSIFDSMWKKERTYARGKEWVPGHSIWKPSCIITWNSGHGPKMCLIDWLIDWLEWWLMSSQAGSVPSHFGRYQEGAMLMFVCALW